MGEDDFYAFFRNEIVETISRPFSCNAPVGTSAVIDEDFVRTAEEREWLRITDMLHDIVKQAAWMEMTVVVDIQSC